MKKKPRADRDIDRAAQKTEWLVAEPENGCELMRGKTLCRMPTFLVVSGKGGSVAVCIECWDRSLEIAADASVDTLELRRKYEREAVALLPIESNADKASLPEGGDIPRGTRRVVRQSDPDERDRIQGDGIRARGGDNRKRKAS